MLKFYLQVAATAGAGRPRDCHSWFFPCTVRKLEWLGSIDPLDFGAVNMLIIYSKMGSAFIAYIFNFVVANMIISSHYHHLFPISHFFGTMLAKDVR